MSSGKLFHKIKSIALVSSSASLLGGIYLYATNDERVFEHILMPTFRLFSAESAHEIAVQACKYKFLLPINVFKDPETLVRVLINECWQWRYNDLLTVVFRVLECKTFFWKILLESRLDLIRMLKVSNNNNIQCWIKFVGLC